MRGFGKVLLASFVAASGFFLASGASALGPANDFDGDGYSDPLFINIANDGSLNWSVISGQTGTQITSLQSVGHVGDNITPAKWFTKTHASLGYVTLQKGTGLIWKALSPDNQWQSFTFGKNGDTAVAGGDFDGDGISDGAIVHTQKNGSLLWTVRHDMFAPAIAAAAAKKAKAKGHILSTVQKVIFGHAGDTPFFASPAGGADYIAVLKADGSAIQLRAVYSAAARTIALKGRASGSLTPVPVRRGALPDFILLAKRTASSTNFTTISMHGTTVGKSSVSATGDIILGRFTTPATVVAAVQHGSQFTLLNPRTGGTTSASWSGNIPVDDININTYYVGPPPTPTPPPPHGRQDNPPPPVGSLNAVCSDMHPMDRSVLYKNGSGGTADSRTGRPAFLWYDGDNDDPYVNKLYVLASNGHQIGIMGLYSPSIRPLVRFYSGYPPGTMDTGSQLIAKAKAEAGKQTIYIYTNNGNCWGPILDPNGRSGGQ